MRPSYEDQFRVQDTEELGDNSVKAIATMLSDIKSGAMDVLDPPLKYNHVLLSWPDFEYEFAHADRIHLASSLAGLNDFHGHGSIASRFALAQEGVSKACYDPEKDMDDTLCDPSLPNLPTILVVSYSTASLSLTLHTRLWGDMPWPERLMDSPALGASFANATSQGDPTEYWIKVRESIASVIGNATIDYILLLGSHARDPELLGAIKGVLDRCGNIGPSIVDRYMEYRSSPDDETSALFAAARGAAVNARIGMETGWKACDEPPWCCNS
ncbi:uncharacterized protein TRUGW13939_07622 [Talaromyces rugulosus]|uniref:Uncharacterized protein n=1 Tax=Talaromyces rugulosus TaxID=121627 RepID=A0A7H8R2K1_TALRU|nr:uncharacterized protein TRUGW13939_07622 [Talaromyces rugulosus]QKX60477.1 hypothetical protein TRUGW13939_07622 [Talaromyces rugulosus]